MIILLTIFLYRLETIRFVPRYPNLSQISFLLLCHIVKQNQLDLNNYFCCSSNRLIITIRYNDPVSIINLLCLIIEQLKVLNFDRLTLSFHLIQLLYIFSNLVMFFVFHLIAQIVKFINF